MFDMRYGDMADLTYAVCLPRVMLFQTLPHSYVKTHLVTQQKRFYREFNELSSVRTASATKYKQHPAIYCLLALPADTKSKVRSSMTPLFAGSSVCLFLGKVV